MNTIKIAGVPEHFNAPWKYAIAEGLFAKANLNLEFIDYGDGTGAMCRDLSNGVLDMAVVLTEGIIKYQQHDPSIKIISNYVDTPLTWGIHVSDATIASTADLKNKIFAVSRLGSGSHLMLKLLAQQQGWAFSKLKFLECGAIDNLASAVLSNEADAFLWEIFTSRAYLNQYQLRLLNTLSTSWPCFQIVATEAVAKNQRIMDQLCDVIFSVCSNFNADHQLAIHSIQTFYDLKTEDIKAWLKTVIWSEQHYLIDFEQVKDFIKDKSLS